MSLPVRRVILTLIWMQILLLGVVNRSVSAQEGDRARLAPVNTEEFPEISTYLDVRTPQGEFIHSLESQHITIIEDGKRLPVAELSNLHTGVQLVLAVSPGPSFDIRDVQGLSRYDYLVQALDDWAQSRQGSTVDDLSLLTAEGSETTHTTDLERWAAVLASYQPVGREVAPDFDVLARALDAASDPTTNPGMSRAVLFITSLPEQDVSLGLQSLAARANQQGVKIYVWMVASSELFFSPQAEGLSQLADQTGGELFAYSGQEAIPSPEEYFQPLRDVYYLAYNSQITTSGLHQVSAEVNFNGQVFNTPVQDFELEVLPPNIAFVSPPMEIERAIIDRSEVDNDLLMPTSQDIELLVEFPDGYARSLNKTTLLVDGAVEAVNTGEPFELFVWDLSDYTTSGEHILTAEIEDDLGLTYRSADTSVQVIVENPSTNPLRVISQNRSILAVIVIAISGVTLLLVLVLGGRLRPGFWRDWRRKKKKSDPVTQPVHVEQEPTTQPRSTWINRLQWPRRRVTTKSYAQLIPLIDANQEDSSPPIAITGNKVTFGTDPEKVDQVLDDLSINDLHAKLIRISEGEFRLSDEGSIAGTWVNYSPVSSEGTDLEQGDLIHIGRIGFRFIMRNPKRVRKPVVRPEEPMQ
jgi:hypothetical protein